MVTIATATEADFPAILAFWREATTVESSTDDEDGLRALLAHAPDALLVARDGDGIVGTVIAAFDGWRGSMYRLAVAPSRRRTGIAGSLVAEGERRLRAQGARRLHLIVQAGEEPAREFWAAAGYAATGQLRFVKTLG